MTRQEIMDSFELDSGLVIRSPGKFEAESAWAPYFWDATDCCDELSYPDGTTIYVVMIDDADRAEWPEIDTNHVAALLEESDSGFVSCMLVNQEELDEQEADCDAENESADDNESDEDSDNDDNTLMACQDCLMYVANGDLPDYRDNLESDIQGHIGVPSGRLTCGDSDKDDEFSSSPCECCGSRLGGSRHQLVIMPE
jgi:hypothetical protein